jgi:[protein-PII] uridylyltransferase
VIANRREDRLVFDLQTAVAASFGYEHPESQLQVERGADAPLLLGRQGRHAAQPDPAAQHLGAPAAQRRKHAPRPINERFYDRGGFLEVISDDLYQREPHAVLETLSDCAAQKNIGVKGLSARTLRALYNARHLMDSDFRNDPVNHADLHADPAAAATASRMRSGC